VATFDDEDEGDEHVVRGRTSRFLRLGGLTTSVGASMVGEKLLGAMLPAERRAERARKALERNAAKVVRTMGQMKGAAMKLGQMLSVAPIDEKHVPAEVRDALAVLQRQAPPMAWSLVTRQVEAAFDQPIDAVFRQFEPAPLAAASIGQVHKATLFDGRTVAVKIQYPGVADTLDSDLKNLASLAQLGRAFADKKRLDDFLQEIRDVILAESDYEAEADRLERYGALFESRDYVRVPRPVKDFTRRTVLTMEYVEGEKLDEWLLAQPEDERSGLTIRFVELFAWMFHDLQALHADPHPGNFLVDEEGRFVLLDFGCVKEFDPAFTDGFLDLLVALWQGEDEKLPELFDSLGFGTDGASLKVSPEVLRGWLEIVCAPFMAEGDFDFEAWNPHSQSRRYFLKNLELMKLTPPKEALFYFRVCGGAWGFLQRLKVKGNFRRVAEDFARRRGRWEA
jgi:predicted unusual protein kinase regulating ubiquinone biosynthesis (AarF/ABC1/UbiB family)